MTCASVELLEAMQGIAPVAQRSATVATDTSACDGKVTTKIGGEFVPAFGWDLSLFDQNKGRPMGPVPSKYEVDCPECLKLMLAARGPDADYLAERAA